jgi:hypothetical protein
MTDEVKNIALAIFLGGLPLLLLGYFLVIRWEKKGKENFSKQEKKKNESRLPDKKIPKYFLIIFFPITLYILLGFIILLLLSQLERFSGFLFNCSDFSELSVDATNSWHKKGPAWTIAFPVTVPIIIMIESAIFLYALISVILGNLIKFIRLACETILELWEYISNWFK